MYRPLAALPPQQPLLLTLLDKCESSLQTHILLWQLEIMRRMQPKVNPS